MARLIVNAKRQDNLLVNLADHQNHTLVTDLTLTDASERVNFIDGGALDRDVILPIVSPFNQVLHLVNTGNYYLIALQGTATVCIIAPGFAATLYSNGTTWQPSGSGQRAVIDGQNYTFGGVVASGDDFLAANGRANDLHTNRIVSDIGASHVMQVAGTIDEAAWVIGNNDSIQFEIFKNGVTTGVTFTTLGTSSNVPGTTTLVTTVPVAAGDRIAVASISSNATASVQLRVKNSAAGYLVHFGGDGTIGRRPNVGSDWEEITGDTTPLPHNKMVLTGSGNLVSLAYALHNGVVTDTVQIQVNDVTQATVTLTNGVFVNSVLYGIETFSVSFVEGDTLSLIMDQSFSTGALLSVLTDVPGHSHHFATDPLGSNQFFAAWGNNAGDVDVGQLTAAAMVMALNLGKVKIAWNTTSLMAVDDLQLYKNGAVVAVFGTAVLTGNVDTGVIVAPGDILGVQSLTGTGGDMNLFLTVA